MRKQPDVVNVPWLQCLCLRSLAKLNIARDGETEGTESTTRTPLCLMKVWIHMLLGNLHVGLLSTSTSQRRRRNVALGSVRTSTLRARQSAICTPTACCFLFSLWLFAPISPLLNSIQILPPLPSLSLPHTSTYPLSPFSSQYPYIPDSIPSDLQVYIYIYTWVIRKVMGLFLQKMHNIWIQIFLINIF